MTEKTIQTAIYLRVSSDKQVQEGDSLQAQRAALIDYVRHHEDIHLVGEYMDDGVSGTKEDRDELQRMMDDVRAGKINLILCTKLDRIYRSIRHYLNFQDVLDKAGANWLAIWEPIYDTSTPQGRLIINQMMSIAQFEAENTGQRIRQVQAYKVTQGEVITGSAPAGYRIEGKRLVPSETADSVRAMFETYSRTGSLHVTMRETEHMPGLPRTGGAFKNILTNPIYTGAYRGNPDFCPPLISKDLFDDVQKQLGMNIKKSRKNDYIFSGILVCAHCGRHLGGNTRKRIRGNCVTVNHQYRCPKAYSPIRQCDNRKLVTETALEKYLIARLRPDIESLILSAQAEEAPAKDNSARIKAVEKKLSRLKDLYLAELITMDEYRADREELTAELEELKAQAPEPPRDTAALQAILDGGIETMYWEFTPTEKRQFWRGIFKEIRFDSSRNYIKKYL